MAVDEIVKAARVEPQTADEAELELVNRQSLRTLEAGEVFTFRVRACDDAVDRDHERFTHKALEGFASLFPGRPILMDHQWSAKAQTARVYAAGVEDVEGVKCLVLRAYMLRNEQSAPTIAAIEGGILREVSVGVAVERALCSVCNTDKSRARCQHIPGQTYDGNACHVDLDGAADAYELSFVPVPAQPAAGVVKQYGGENADTQDAPQAGTEAGMRLRLLGASIRINESGV